MDAATGTERQPISMVARRYAGTCSWCDDEQWCSGKYLFGGTPSLPFP